MLKKRPYSKLMGTTPQRKRAMAERDCTACILYIFFVRLLPIPVYI